MTNAELINEAKQQLLKIRFGQETKCPEGVDKNRWAAILKQVANNS